MYILHYSPGASSLAVHALLHSLAVPFEVTLADFQKGQTRTPEFLHLNPFGQVPVLVEGENCWRESAAIAMYLADKHHSALLPKNDVGLQRLRERLCFYISALHQAYGMYFLGEAHLRDDAKEAALALAAKRIGKLWREVDQELEGKNFVAGDAPTLPDLFHATIANWTPTLKHEVTLGENVKRVAANMAALPYFEAALAAEGVTYSITAAA